MNNHVLLRALEKLERIRVSVTLNALDKLLRLNSFPGHRGRKGLVGGSLPRSAGLDLAHTALSETFKRGGFTIKTIDEAHEPKKGYVVAQHPELGDIVENAEGVSRPELKRRVRDYIKKNKAILSKDGMYLGLWLNAEDKGLYFDVPTVILDREIAIQSGIDSDQIAIWDIEGLSEIPTGGSGKKGPDS